MPSSIEPRRTSPLILADMRHTASNLESAVVGCSSSHRMLVFASLKSSDPLMRPSSRKRLRSCVVLLET